MNDIRFGGARPTHLIEAADDMTDQQMAEVIRRITDGGLPVVLPKGWSIHPIEYAGYTGPHVRILDIDERPPHLGLILAALSGFIVGIAVMALLLIGGII